MISYCSNEHKQMHNEKHMEICGYLKEYINSHMENETGVDHMTWMNSRLEFLSSIKERLPLVIDRLICSIAKSAIPKTIALYMSKNLEFNMNQDAMSCSSV
ncbi:hypothetical protein EAI_01457 [Harpegnathos saltator]|uniref:Uncharacterized protein n=1 Tax=Harpegnathos saltator TaxID=610380 RepID=E2BMH0_HARSA|nr:hypothetical protein EAI_01457 [Harpegnathos saltator]